MLTSLNIPRIAGRSPIPLPKKEHRIARSAKEPRLEAVLYPASGSGSGPASRPSPRSSTPISRALPGQTSHKHVGAWDVNNYTKFICLRGSSDSASPFISVTAIQLTPSLPSYTTQTPLYCSFTSLLCVNFSLCVFHVDVYVLYELFFHR